MRNLTKNYIINISQPMRHPPGKSWKMDSSVQNSPVSSCVRSCPQPHIRAWGGGGCYMPVLAGAGDELGGPPSLMEAAGAVGCSVLGYSWQLGRAAQAAASFREEVWILDGAPEYV